MRAKEAREREQATVRYCINNARLISRQRYESLLVWDEPADVVKRLLQRKDSLYVRNR